MYPAEELKGLAARKRALRRDIALHRAQCATAAARLAQPLAWLDRMLATWRRLAPLAAMPLALLAARIVLPRYKILPKLVRWAPVVFSAARGLGAVFLPRHRSAPP
ncbi:MAG: hypothetical protein Q8N18_13300 [Opitutaceae bacterium]|nr:hypothetical protein [Opitutaceae bacterium]